MPIFIICCLLLTTLVQVQWAFLTFLNIESVWLAGAGVAGLFLLAGCLKKLPGSIWHDGFACAGLWAWYGFWKPFFSEGSPMFYMFPVYFALLGAWMLFGFINKSALFDAPSQEAFLHLQKYLFRFDSSLLAAVVLICIAFPEHYLSYPLAMTFFIVRSAFQRCVEIIES